MQADPVPDDGEEERFSEALDRRATDRAWRRNRRLLLLAMIPLIVLLIANLALALAVSQMRGDLDELRAEGPAPDGGSAAETSVSAEEMAALRRRVDDLQRAIKERDTAPASDSVDALEDETARIGRQVDRALTHVRCTDDALRRLESSLRRLLTRDLDPQSYVDEEPLPTCP